MDTRIFRRSVKGVEAVGQAFWYFVFSSRRSCTEYRSFSMMLLHGCYNKQSALDVDLQS